MNDEQNKTNDKADFKKLLKEIEKERNDENLFTREDVERLDESLGIAPQRTDADTKALP
jgi:hypothetical protein